LRELHDRDPAAFEFEIAELQRAGKSWSDELPPIEKGVDGKLIKVTRDALVALLADFLNSHMSAPKYAREWAKGFRRIYFTPYFPGGWESAETVGYYLRKAKRLARRDDDFAGLVEAYLEDPRELEREELDPDDDWPASARLSFHDWALQLGIGDWKVKKLL
jgi:hypothetical protein